MGMISSRGCRGSISEDHGQVLLTAAKATAQERSLANRAASRGRLALFGASAGALISAMAWASGAAAQSSPPDVSGSASTIGEVVVTAQRRPELQTAVPEAITVVGVTDLTERHSIRLDDYFLSIPGLTVNDDGQGLVQLSMRGLTTGAYATPTVGIYINDTPIGASTNLAYGDLLAPDIDPTELQQIEVLKGPQGTLYGANTLGGLIKYVTKQPDPNNFFGSASTDLVTIPDHGAGYGARTYLNIPLVSDQLALSVDGFTRQDPGFVSDPVTGTKDVNAVFTSGGRAELRYTPTSNFTVDLSALTQRRHADGSDQVDYNTSTGQPVYGDLEQARVPGTDVDTETLNLFNATVSADLGKIHFVSSTSYSESHLESDTDLSPLFSSLADDVYSASNIGVPMHQNIITQKFTEEDRANGSIGNLDLTGGVFFTHERNSVYQHFNTVNGTTGQSLSLPDFYTYTFDSQYTEEAVFIDGTYHLTPRWDFQAGVRYSFNQQTGNQINSGEINYVDNLTSTSSASVATYLVGTSYKLTDDVLVYGRISSGYRPGGPNVQFDPSVPKVFQSDSTTDYEIGTKLFALDKKLYVDAALYYVNWNNIQLQSLDSIDNAFTANGGSAVSQGLELSSTYRPTTHLTFTASLGLNDAHLTAPAPPSVYAPSGSRLPFGARVTASGSVEYRRPFGNGLTGVVGVDGQFDGQRLSGFTGSASLPRLNLPAYGLVGLHAGLEYQKYTLTAYVRNVGDSRGFLSGAEEFLGDGTQYGIAVVQPRLVGMSISAKF